MITDLSISVIMDILKSSPLLNGADIIEAYPNCDCASRLEKPCVALSFGGTGLKSSYALESEREGEATFSVSVYSPFGNGASGAVSLFESVIKALDALTVLSISSNGVSVDTLVGAYAVRARIGVSAELNGGD